MDERVQKIMAKSGLGSRRACEKIIEAGRVRVNGKIIKLGDKADSQKDQIRVDGHSLKFSSANTYIAINKPRGVLSNPVPNYDRATVLDIVDATIRLFPVGRLDLDSEGLMLLTDDGDMANKLTHPRYGHEKEYRVLISAHVRKDQLNTWERGVLLEDGFQTGPVSVIIDKVHGKGTWLRVTMSEGHKRQIRESAKSVGLHVVKLIRVRIGSLKLGGLKSGKHRNLSEAEIQELKNLKGRK
jgi:23S rRNA pseudouridine2605 synthase